MGEVTDVSCLLDARAELGEGPIWDGSIGRMLWVDILSGTIHSTRLSDGDDLVLDVEIPVGAVAPRVRGGWALATGIGFRLLDMKGFTQTDLNLGMGPDMRMNDGACDRYGRFFAGSMAYVADTPVGELMVLEPDKTVRTVLTDVTISNGIGWSPDEDLLYYVDTPTRRVDVMDYHPETGEVENRRTLFEFGELAGAPDGLTVDNDGCLWVAAWGGWAVHRITPGGKLDRSVRMPVSQVTKPGFGGESGEVMVVTSARIDLSEEALEDEPQAGGFFVVDAGVAGPFGNPYSG